VGFDIVPLQFWAIACALLKSLRSTVYGPMIKESTWSSTHRAEGLPFRSAIVVANEGTPPAGVALWDTPSGVMILICPPENEQP